jgi:hypothetical protein
MLLHYRGGGQHRYDPLPPTFIVWVLKCTDLPTDDVPASWISPWVLLTFDSKECITTTKQRTTAPEWNEDFKFVAKDRRDWVDFEVFHGPNDETKVALGSGAYCLDRLFTDQEQEILISLDGPPNSRAALTVRFSTQNFERIFAADVEQLASQSKGVPCLKATQQLRSIMSPSLHSAHIKNDITQSLVSDAQLRNEFRKYDTTDIGWIDKSTLKHAYLNFHHYGLRLSDAELDHILQTFRSLPDNKLSYEEFCLFMLQHVSKR